MIIQPELATQITFVAIILIPAFVFLGAVVFVLWKILPVFIRQTQQLIDNNTELRKIAQQNADQIKTAETALQENTEALQKIQPELVRQTNAIENTNFEIKSQSLDFRNYQTLVSDGLSNHTSQIEANTKSIAELQTTFSTLPDQIVKAVRDELACQTILQEFQALRSEVTRIIRAQQDVRITGTLPVTNPTTVPPTNKS